MCVGFLQNWEDSLVTVNYQQTNRLISSGEAVQHCVPHPLFPWQGIHGETKQRPDTRLKEHKDACIMGHMEKSAVSEYAWTKSHALKWDEAKLVDHAMIEESLYIQMTLRDMISISIMTGECQFLDIGHQSVQACTECQSMSLDLLP